MFKPTNKVALIDLDGTLADYDVAMSSAFQNLGMTFPSRGETTEYENKIRKLIQNQTGFWRNLPRYQPGFEILSMVYQLGFNLMILTQGPMSTPLAWTEKIEWCLKHVPNIPVTIARDKSLVYGRVLVDDWPEYFLPWLEVRPRGVVVCPKHPWNENVAHPRVFIYDNHNPDSRECQINVGQVKNALINAFDRP